MRASAAFALETGPMMALTVKEERTQENPDAALVSEIQCAPQRQDS